MLTQTEPEIPSEELERMMLAEDANVPDEYFDREELYDEEEYAYMKYSRL